MQSFFETIFDAGSFDIIVVIGLNLVFIVVILAVIMAHVAYCTYAERKIIGRMQARLGPVHVGPHGLLQPIADGIKLFFKEDIIPENADKTVFYIAPLISLFAAMTSLAVIPWFQRFALADINIGLLFILALSSIGAYGVVMGGWASNSKYAFLGALRASAQIISYEIAMGLSLVGVMIMAGSLNLADIVEAQEKFALKMYLGPQLIGFVIFMFAMLAETNRSPFDMPEAESELVAGYFTEYSSIRFSLFFMAEYMGMIVMSIIAIICFLGGASPWFGIPGVIWLFVKLYAFLFFFFWIRATLPRVRYDQLMNLGWKVLIPLALFNVIYTAIFKYLGWYG